MATPTTFTPKNVDAAQLGTGVTTVLAVPANTNGIKITSLTLVNDTSTSCAAGINLSPSGVAPADTNILVKAMTIPGDGLPVELVPKGGLFLEASGTVTGTAATASQVTYHMSYIEFN